MVLIVVSSASLIMHVRHEASRGGSHFFFCPLPLVIFTIPLHYRMGDPASLDTRRRAAHYSIDL